MKFGITGAVAMRHPSASLPGRAIAGAVVLLTFLAFPRAHFAKQNSTSSEFTVHEWGTFTSISGKNGRAIDWLPLTGSTDLPSFVEHLREPNFKGGLRGTIRMETPVIYFYSPRETTVSVNVSFAKGLITEWYPHSASAAAIDPRKDFSLYLMQGQGSISWNSVHIEPGGATDFPRDASKNHYYAARETSSAPIRMPTPSGDQHERFLFYRGVSALTPPISAQLSADGTVLVQSLLQEEIPDVILFERRGDKIGYRILGPLHDQASLALPQLEGSLPALFSDLDGILISQGLHADEAHALLETWKSSWFEEGSRLFYIVPCSFVDSLLPLSISPAPAVITRVFVGRLELITPATEQAVESAFASSDRAALAKYSRFLEPILQTMIQESADPARQRRLTAYLLLALNGIRTSATASQKTQLHLPQASE
jgi:hypothetical protein